MPPRPVPGDRLRAPEPGPVLLSACQLEHRLREVAADDPPLGTDAAGELEGEVAGAAADVERAVSGRELGAVGGALAPAAVEARGHDRFMTS